MRVYSTHPYQKMWGSDLALHFSVGVLGGAI
jgi:hypothetical protein